MKKHTLRYYIITGLISILPIVITYWIISILFQFFSNPGALLVSILFKDSSPMYISEIVGFVLTILFILIFGVLVSNIIGAKIYKKLEQFLSKIPIVSYVYSTIKKITDSISGSNKQTFKKVIYLEYPKKDLWSIGMVTGESKNEKGEEFYHVIILTTPNPTSGYLIFVNKKNIIHSNLTIEEGLKTIISGGILAKEKNQIQ